MLPVDKLTVPGEHAFSFLGEAGLLEAVLTVPSSVRSDYMVLLGHPHSLQGGTMNNKVVTTLARTFKDCNMPSIRFNFRGVGQSLGHYDEGQGESEDMLLLLKEWQQHWPHARVILAGFSFGSYVAYRAAAACRAALLITVAPPVHHYDYQEFSLSPWVVLHGDDDEVVPLDKVLDFVANASLPPALLRFPETSHFFHGKLMDLRRRVTDVIHEYTSV